MRLIDADALIEKLKQHHDFFVKAWGGFREMPIQDKARCDELSNSIAEIFNAPSIDIVHCQDCKYWDDRRKDAWWSEEGACYLTSRLGDATYRNHDDFCSYGERREP